MTAQGVDFHKNGFVATGTREQFFPSLHVRAMRTPVNDVRAMRTTLSQTSKWTCAKGKVH